MIGRSKGVLAASLLLASTSAAAQDASGRGDPPPLRVSAEVAIGVFDHGANVHPLGGQLIARLPALPPGQFYDGTEEDGTIDIQLVYRSTPLHLPLQPRLAAKAQISTADRTSFASFGVEWRQQVLRGRLYGQAGIGVTIHDGYRFTPDPFAPGLTDAEAWRRYAIYRHRTSFGSLVLFNPNLALGVRLTRHWAAELAWEHVSHRQLFSRQNPGLDSVGLRLVRTLGAGR